MQPIITFQPSGQRVPASPENTIWDLSVAAGVELLSTCGGKGSCGKCKVIVQANHTEQNLNEEQQGWEADGTSISLACQTRLPQGGTVWIPEQSRPDSQVILTSGFHVQLTVNPRLRMFSVQLPQENINIMRTWEERLLQAMEPQLENQPRVPLAVLQELPKAALAKGGLVTIILAREEEIIGIQPGSLERCLGLAVDLGTTTAVAFLTDLLHGEVLAVASEVNPQVSRGDDVISRISYVSEYKNGGRELTALATDCVNSLVESACSQAGVSSQEIYECLLVGNTAMHHIYLGLEAQGLVRAPYAPVVNHEVEGKAKEFGLNLAPESIVSWLPVKAGFVGADIVAVLLAVDASSIEQPTLILDLGTNGEIVLAAGGQLFCCSTAAGPAFEGGHIRWGMRGETGAVEKVSLCPNTLNPKLKTIGNGRPKGLCGSGLVSLISQLVLNKVLTSSGAFDPNLANPRLRQGEDGTEYVLAFAQETLLGQDLVLTAQDVAELQMAKAAIRAGSELLLMYAGLDQVCRVILAGAFGNYLDPLEALSLGFFPQVPASCIEGVGNAAAAGALKALADYGARKQASELARDMVYVELSSHPEFQDFFVDSLHFPEAAEQV
ncbi:MAG: ASKHA domain-containing protein [Thermodesulfobacteriota bacterium]